MTLLQSSTVQRAVDNIVKWGDTDIFPFPVDNHAFYDQRDSVVNVLQQISADFESRLSSLPLPSHSTLAPVGYNGFRWATQIDPMWNAYLLSLVLSLAPEIESVRIPEAAETVFSYRYRPDGGDSVFAQDGWRRFQQRTRLLAEQHNYVVAVDIADFYSRIYHHRLENALRRVDAGATRTRQIKSILSTLSNNTSYGLPVGGPAARLLSELVLDSVDRLIQAQQGPGTFCRYADDYRFFVNDLPAAYRALGFLSEKLLRNEGLSLQKSKTRIMTSPEYLSTLDPLNPAPGSAAQFLGLHIHFDPYSPTAEDDYENLKRQIDDFDVVGLLREELTKGRIHAAVTRRLVQALRFMDVETRGQAVLSLLDNVETLAPVIPQVMLAVRDAVDSDPALALTAHAKVRDLITSSHYVASIELNLSYMVRVLAGSRSVENEQLLIRMYGGSHGFGSGPAPTIQRDIMLTMARWGVRYWLSDQKNYIATAHPWVRRAFLVGSYVLGDEGAHWRGAIRASLTDYEMVLRDWAARKVQQPNWLVPV